MRQHHIRGIAWSASNRPLIALIPIAFWCFIFLAVAPAWAAAPPAPTNLVATMASSHQINLAWQDNATNEAKYYVERSPNGSKSWTVVATLGTNITNYQNTRLTQNTIYYYRVRCKVGSTYSRYSNTANATTATLAAPTSLTAAVASVTQIALSWTDNTAYETRYFIERSPNGSSSWIVLGTVASNVSGYQDTGLTSGTAYYYRVRAYDSTGYSAYSNTVNQTIRTIKATAGTNGAIAPSGTIGVANGATQVFTMTPNNGYKIATVTVDGSSVATDPNYTFTNITANHAISATFAGDTYTITASTGPNGSISPSGSVVVSAGTSTTFTFMPTTGYHVSDVQVDGASIGALSSYTFSNIGTNHAISAIFSVNSYTITATAGANGTISPSGAVVVNSGANQPFMMTPNAGYSISSVVVDGSSVATSGTYTFSNVLLDHTIAASFGDITPPTGSIVINGGASATNNAVVTLSLTAADSGSGVAQMQFSNDGSTWSNTEPYATSKSWTLSAGEGTRTVSARFMDNEGNWMPVPCSSTITLDSSLPIVTISSPVSGATYSAVQLLTYTATEGTVVVKVDGTVAAKVSGDDLGLVSQGTHTVRVESTDSAGNTGFAETSFNIDTIAPAVSITSPTAITTRDNNPLLAYTVNEGTVVVRVDGNIVSTMSGSNLDMLPDGRHTVVVESTDSVGNKGSAAVDFEINSTTPLTISGVEASAHALNTALFESSNIYFSVNGRAAVTLKIYSGSTYPVENPKYTITRNISNAGTFSFTWDGKDNVGNVLRDSDYLYVLGASSGSVTATYSPAAPTGTGTVTCTQEASSDPYKNDPLTISYSVSRAARIDIRISAGLTTFSVLENVGHAAGNYTFDWDGRDKSGAIVSAGAVAKCYVMSLLYDNHIVTTGDAPKIASLQSDPYEINLAYGHIARIKYNLLKDANVTVKLTPPAGTAITLVDNQLQTAGPIEVAWNGLFDQQDKLFAVSQEGVYTIQVIARNPLTGSEYQMRGSLSVAY